MREERVYAILSAASGVTSIVGTRIFWDVAEASAAAPFVVLSLVSGVPDDELSGDTAFDRIRVQVDCYATTKSAALTLGAAVRAAIQPNYGHLIGFNPAPLDPDSRLYRDSADYEVIEFT